MKRTTRITTTAAPSADLPEPPATNVLYFLRVPVVNGLEASIKSANIPAANGAIGDMFSDCLPMLLHWSAAEKRLPTDYVDLERLVRVGLPSLLAEWIFDLMGGVTGRLYRAEFVAHVRGAMLTLIQRLDHAPLRAGRRDGAQFAELLIELEDSIRQFSVAALVTGPPPAPTTKPQRAAARARRLSNWALMRETQKLPSSFSAVCRLAGKARTGKDSGKDWLNGKLPDESSVSRAIQGVLDFKVQK
jgi:hypothetical protein